MGKTYACITPQIKAFIEAQQMFFVATAPTDTEQYVNVSPKGLDSFRVLDEHTVVYADLVGSGIETVAHLQDNGRIVVMFCAFEGAPKIVRLHGRGEVITADDAAFEEYKPLFPGYTGLRAFIKVNCTRVSDSCGFSVPLYEYQGQRSQLTDWAEVKGLTGINEYIKEKNTASIDGLPGLEGE